MLRLHPICSEHAVISARRPRVFGSTAPEAVVTVQLAGQTAHGNADATGHWRVEFPPLPPGGPHTLIANDATGAVRARDILLGDVWLGSGQSNMESPLSLTKDTDADIAEADEPRLRVFMVGKAQDATGAAATLGGLWVVSTPRDAPAFSAIGYFFGRRLIADTDRPCGIIVSAWGGSAIAPWLSEATLSSRPEYASFRAELAQGRAQPEPAEQGQPHQDPGIAPHAADWAATELDDSAWTPLPVPGQWQDHGWAFNGAVWFRRTVEIPAGWVGRALELHLGVVDDCDTTFVNGVFVGGIGNETPNWWSTPRNHLVPATLVTGTTLTIAVRVFDNWGEGGIMGNVRLRPLDASSAETLNLTGTWRAKSELELPLRSPSGPALMPSSLWNAMIHPLLCASLDGILWYQGESDVGRARLYPRLLTDLITSWRRAFDAPELPFGIVQLANFEERVSEPVEAPWAELREAQRRVAATVPACGLASAIDAGEADDIHPRYKKIVGERLALWALRETHGRTELAYSGPTPAECWTEAAGLRVRFTHAEGLRVRGDALRGFTLQDATGRWHRADTTTISGDTVLVSATSIPDPVAVRYGWQSNPETTLENAAGLPASPFRLTA